MEALRQREQVEVDRNEKCAWCHLSFGSAEARYPAYRNGQRVGVLHVACRMKWMTAVPGQGYGLEPVKIISANSGGASPPKGQKPPYVNFNGRGGLRR